MPELSKFFNLLYILKQKIVLYFLALFDSLYFKIYISFILILNLSVWVFAIFIVESIKGEQIALHYNVDFGVDYYGDVEKIYILPFLGLIVTLINISLINIVKKRNDRRFVSHILLTVALIINIILLASITSIYLINFR